MKSRPDDDEEEEGDGEHPKRDVSQKRDRNIFETKTAEENCIMSDYVALSVSLFDSSVKDTPPGQFCVNKFSRSALSFPRFFFNIELTIRRQMIIKNSDKSTM